MKKKFKMLTKTEISEVLKEQQEKVEIIDEYIQCTPMTTNTIKPDFYANFVMVHIFVNIRNSYQDGVFISQGLINSTRYYVSTSLSHAQRTAQEFLIDLAYIMTDLEHKSGYEYLRYLKFIVDKEEKNKKIVPKGKYKEMFPPELGLPLKAGSQWSDTKTGKKIEQGLKLYKIELPDFADRRSEIHKQLSSTAHGNDNTINTLIQTPEKNLHKLEEDLTKSIAFFEATLESALKCYVRLYLGRNVDHGEIVKSMFPDKGDSHGK